MSDTEISRAKFCPEKCFDPFNSSSSKLVHFSFRVFSAKEVIEFIQVLMVVYKGSECGKLEVGSSNSKPYEGVAWPKLLSNMQSIVMTLNFNFDSLFKICGFRQYKITTICIEILNDIQVE
ncbi:uncharacterized protein LOC133807151 [Humulus lupulus]|uniref:uncharacterized protein LOC133807151 n=1 Tax=Humulus lupulus TaxID=3486 RepID=UPI002B4184B6|nr:uncharacterized protein LOC133807151 [Humulus lupulus]